MEIEIRVDGKLWLSINMKENFGRKVIKRLERLFDKVIAAKDAEKTLQDLSTVVMRGTFKPPTDKWTEPSRATKLRS